MDSSPVKKEYVPVMIGLLIIGAVLVFYYYSNSKEDQSDAYLDSLTPEERARLEVLSDMKKGPLPPQKEVAKTLDTLSKGPREGGEQSGTEDAVNVLDGLQVGPRQVE